MSRRICVALHDAILKLQLPGPAAPGDARRAEAGQKCIVKVVMTGSADDGPDWRPHPQQGAARAAGHAVRSPSDPSAS
ncbi:MAG: hypothetical protein U0935_22405 [Pirellulales bacterium]